MGRKVDIWSLGITMLEMVYVRPPMFELEPCRYMFKLGFESKVSGLQFSKLDPLVLPCMKRYGK